MVAAGCVIYCLIRSISGNYLVLHLIHVLIWLVNVVVLIWCGPHLELVLILLLSLLFAAFLILVWGLWERFFGHWYWDNCWVYLLLSGWWYCVADIGLICAPFWLVLLLFTGLCCYLLEKSVLLFWYAGNYPELLVASELIHTFGSLIWYYLDLVLVTMLCPSLACCLYLLTVPISCVYSCSVVWLLFALCLALSNTPYWLEF
jgi:hypothetical protein